MGLLHFVRNGMISKALAMTLIIEIHIILFEVIP